MTLTELSYYVRKMIPFVVLFGLIFLIIFYSFKLLFVYLDQNKEKPIITDTIFGKIDPPVFPSATSSAGFRFTLDTVEGVPVTSTDTAKIFFMPKQATRFGYREKIYLMAQTLGFNTEITNYKLEGNIATFQDTEKELTINIGNFNFKYETKPDAGDVATASAFIPSRVEIQNKATDFLRSIGRYPDELAKGATNIIYLKYNPEMDKYLNVENQTEANLVEVDFYRPDVDGVPIATPKFFNSQNFVVMMFTEGGYKVVKAQISFFEKSDAQIGIYPVKTGETAWNELNEGKGKVVAATIGKKNIVIKNMKIYYYDPDSYQTYFQPVYVFLGDGDFVGFVPAVTDDYITE